MVTLGIVLREPGRNTRLQAVNAHCLECNNRLAWIVIRYTTGCDIYCNVCFSPGERLTVEYAYARTGSQQSMVVPIAMAA